MATTPETAAAAPKTMLFAAHPVDTIKVESRDGDALGSIQTLMLSKATGRPTHAVLALGGFLGIGKSFYPLPFELLRYDALADGYVVTIDRRMLEGGPSWANNTPAFDQDYADRVAKYYDVAAPEVAVAAPPPGD